MAQYITSKQILAKIGCDKLALYRGEGYWYFIYNDIAAGKYDSCSVYCMYLGSDIDFWVREGKDFVSKMEN